MNITGSYKEYYNDALKQVLVDLEDEKNHENVQKLIEEFLTKATPIITESLKKSQGKC